MKLGKEDLFNLSKQSLKRNANFFIYKYLGIDCKEEKQLVRTIEDNADI